MYTSFVVAMPRRKIYISSTYDDLISYRRTAASVIEDCGHIPVDSYKAGPKPTVQQCLDDVDRSDVFVGIIGLRYGWIPKDGDPRSITHREFDQAASKTRFMFLETGKRADLDAPIRNFRASIPDAVEPAIFDGLDEFSGALRKTLKDRLGITGTFPPLLPYFCDRSEQYNRVDDRLWERRQANDSRVRVFVAHADTLQSGPQFVEVLRHKLGDFPATKDLGQPVPFEIEWPRTFGDPANFRRRLEQAVGGQTLKNRNARREEIARFLQDISGPVLIHTYLSTSEYKQSGEAGLKEFCKFWEEWTELRRAHPIIVVARIEYELPRPSILNRVRTPGVDRSNRAIREFLAKRFAPNRDLCDVLSELPRISADEAIRWSHRNEVRAHCGGIGLEPQIRDIYQSRFDKEPEHIPRMEPLAKELARLLKECV